MKKYEKNIRILKPVLPLFNIKGEKITKENSRTEIVVSLPYYLRDDYKRANKGGNNRIISGNSSEHIRKILDLYGYFQISYINALFTDAPYRGIHQYFCEFNFDVPSKEYTTPYHGKILKSDSDILVKKYFHEIFSLKPVLVLCSGDIFYWLFKGIDPQNLDYKGLYEFQLNNINFFYLILHNVFDDFDLFSKDLKKWRNILPLLSLTAKNGDDCRIQLKKLIQENRKTENEQIS